MPFHLLVAYAALSFLSLFNNVNLNIFIGDKNGNALLIVMGVGILFWSPWKGPPDLSRYRPLQVLSQEEFPFGIAICYSLEAFLTASLGDPSRRVILVGDIHGQYDHLQCVTSPSS
jgi:hypothetical protein